MHVTKAAGVLGAALVASVVVLASGGPDRPDDAVAPLAPPRPAVASGSRSDLGRAPRPLAPRSIEQIVATTPVLLVEPPPPEVVPPPRAGRRPPATLAYRSVDVNVRGFRGCMRRGGPPRDLPQAADWLLVRETTRIAHVGRYDLRHFRRSSWSSQQFTDGHALHEHATQPAGKLGVLCRDPYTTARRWADAELMVVTQAELDALVPTDTWREDPGLGLVSQLRIPRGSVKDAEVTRLWWNERWQIVVEVERQLLGGKGARKTTLVDWELRSTPAWLLSTRIPWQGAARVAAGYAPARCRWIDDPRPQGARAETVDETARRDREVVQPPPNPRAR